MGRLAGIYWVWNTIQRNRVKGLLMYVRRIVMPTLVVLSMALGCIALAEDGGKKNSPKEKGQKEQKSEFLRVTHDARENPLALEAALVTYSPQDCGEQGPTVDLVSAVHVAEKSFYDELNRLFPKYDVVLYELIAPEGTRIPKGAKIKSDHPVSMLQRGMTEILKLEFQLSAVDYTRRNFVHADLSPDQFGAAMKKRGESMWTMMFRMMGYSMARQGQGSTSDVQLLMALFNKNRALALKRAMAEQFQEMGGTLNAIEGPDGSAIIADRNKRALDVLRKQIEAGKKKIAIFYGAGHMQDMEKHLHNDFGLVPVNTRWIVAWNLKDDPKPAVIRPAEKKAEKAVQKAAKKSASVEL